MHYFFEKCKKLSVEWGFFISRIKCSGQTYSSSKCLHRKTMEKWNRKTRTGLRGLQTPTDTKLTDEELFISAKLI